MKKSLYTMAVPIVMIGLFTYTAFAKLAALKTFTGQLAMSPLLHDVAPVIAIGIPITELIISGFLLHNPTRLIGLYSSVVLLAIFTLYIIAMLTISPNIPCACGGALSFLTWKSHITFNLFFMSISILGIWLHRTTKRKGVKHEKAISV